MLEFILLFIFFYLVINAFTRRKTRRRPRNLDAELRALIQDHNTNTGIALDIKRYLLDIINDNNHDLEKFSDSRINQAQNLLDRAGPAAFYWMGEIAAQLARLSAAQINGIPTNVNAELRDGATPEAIIDIVVKSGFFETSLAAYGQEHQPCPRCGREIRRIAFGGRSSHFCPKCQVKK